MGNRLQIASFWILVINSMSVEANQVDYFPPEMAQNNQELSSIEMQPPAMPESQGLSRQAILPPQLVPDSAMPNPQMMPTQDISQMPPEQQQMVPSATPDQLMPAEMPAPVFVDQTQTEYWQQPTVPQAPLPQIIVAQPKQLNTQLGQNTPIKKRKIIKKMRIMPHPEEDYEDYYDDDYYEPANRTDVIVESYAPTPYSDDPPPAEWTTAPIEPEMSDDDYGEEPMIIAPAPRVTVVEPYYKAPTSVRGEAVSPVIYPHSNTYRTTDPLGSNPIWTPREIHDEKYDETPRGRG